MASSKVISPHNGQCAEVLFVKQGSFSSQNPFIATQLERHFPQCSLRVIDFWDVTKACGRFMAWLACMEAIMSYPRSFLRRQAGMAFYAIRTRIARRAYLRAFQKWTGLFTFQTQSMFNASLPGAEHFVLTDHTLLANHRYRTNPFKPETPRSWVAREAKIYRDATCTLTTSRFCAQSLLEDYHLTSDRVVPVFCGANAAAKFYGKHDADKRERAILFLGFDWERKGGPDLVEAFSMVRMRHHEVMLWIAGPPLMSGLPDGVKQFGMVSLERAEELFAKATVFCLPSLREPSAVVLSEALSHGLPIVATDDGGTPDRVIHGETGYLVPPGDRQRLAEALDAVLSDPARASQMGEAGRRLYEQDFSWDAVGKKIACAVKSRLPSA